MLLLLPRVTRKLPAVLVAVVGATVISAIFDLAGSGVATVGSLPAGVPRPSVPWTSVDDVLPLLIAALGITLVSLTDTIATSSARARRGEEVKPNRNDRDRCGERRGGGSSAAAVSTSGSRTASRSSRDEDAADGLVGAGVVASLLFLNSLLSDLPQSALGRCDRRGTLVDGLRRAAPLRTSARAFVLSLVASVGVIVFGVLEGIVIAIVLAVGAVPSQLVAPWRCSAKSTVSAGGTTCR